MKHPAWQTYWPLWLGLAIFASGLAYVGVSVAGGPDRMAYPMDDSYIHMAIAQNLAKTGTWGVNPGQFAPASSSLLWTLILSGAFKLLGTHTWIPFVLASICGVLLLSMVNFIGLREQWTTGMRASVLAIMVIVMPLVPMSVSGMEHILHTGLTISVLYLLWRLPSREQALPAGYSVMLLVAVFLTTAVRFEGLFLAAAVGFMLLLQRRWLLASGVIAVSFIPVALFGAWSLSNGWTWLPSSVRLKGNFQNNVSLLQSLEGIVKHLSGNLFGPAHIPSLLLCPVIALWLLPRRYMNGRTVGVAAVFLLVLIQHLAFASIGWFYRYEAYLMAAQVFIIGLIVADWWSSQSSTLPGELKTSRGIITLALALVIAAPQFGRGIYAVWKTPMAMKNIHDQQYEMSDFVRRYYPGSVVAATDIGALSFRGNAEIVDLAGLGDLSVFQARIKGKYNAKFIGEHCADKKVEIAVVYDFVINAATGLPKDWQRVGTLQIEHNVICADPTVSFYATNPEAIATLAKNLKDFAGRVPSDVHVHYF